MRLGALAVYLIGGDLCIEVPSASPGTRSHTVTLPDRPESYGVLRRILGARRGMTEPAHLRIGHDTALTQAQCEALLRPALRAMDQASEADKAASLEVLRLAGML